MGSDKEGFIPLKEAELLFEKFKDEYTNTYKNISMRDCLVRNHEIRRLPLYIKSNDNYIETRDNIQNISDEIYVEFENLRRFFHKELIVFSASDFYGYSSDVEEIIKESGPDSETVPVAQLLRPNLDALIGKMKIYPEEWTEIFKEWEDREVMPNIEMKYLK